MRSRWQGLKTVLLFNWHYFVMAAIGVLLLLVVSYFVSGSLAVIMRVTASVIILMQLFTIIATAWVYDLSGLYELPWLEGVTAEGNQSIAIVNAGLDEISGTVRARLPDSKLRIFDFYDESNQTEISIQRARSSGIGHQDSEPVDFSSLPINNSECDTVIVFMAAHEIRDRDNLLVFFNELRRILSDNGRVVVVEHLRDIWNFLAYSIGSFHFLPRSRWEWVFAESRFRIENEMKHTPFVTTFVLSPDGAKK